MWLSVVLRAIFIKMKVSKFVQIISERGQHYFKLDEAISATGLSKKLVLAAIRRLIQKGRLAMPYYEFYVVVPLQYKAYGCLPAEQFIPDLMKELDFPYYVGLLSAANYYGAAHQKPQQFQVVTNQYLSPIKCGRIHVVFIMNQDISNVPHQQVNTPTGYLKLSSAEATAIDLFQYQRRSGGLNNIVTVLSELVESMEQKQLEKCINHMTIELVNLQRFGYCLDLLKEKKFSEVVYRKLKKMKLRTRPLVAGISTRNCERDKKWELYINFKVEPDS